MAAELVTSQQIAVVADTAGSVEEAHLQSLKEGADTRQAEQDLLVRK